ncbi:cytochrome P450 4ae1 isoform X2 [Drosophila novamexicana]|uniref:cytochrome P450 4ae1 isoform X2 n=1 Tax=Drosophila novamexicana TaxID=47314 RepID=UPI0011E59524|nr:cytochrome P450 4ae1 isoform X2 [Drosophila novamexicana]
MDLLNPLCFTEYTKMLLILLVTSLVVFLLRFLLQLFWTERRHRQQLEGVAPNVSQVPLIGTLWQMRDFQPDNLHEKFAAYVKRYGRSFVATTCGRMVLVTAEPRHADALLLSKQQLRKSVVYGALGGWLGNGLLLSRGDRWHAMRKIITPTFHFSILEQYIEVFDRQCNVLVDRLQPLAADSNRPRAFNIYPYMCLAALDIISEAAMGVSVDAQRNVDAPVVQAVKDVTNILATRFMRPHLLPPLLFRLLWPSGHRKQWNGVKCLHSFTDDIIRRRRQLLLHEQQLGKRSALLDTLLQARLEGAPLTDAQIRDEVSTFIFAGHDTTTSAASFCLFLLSRHASVQRRLFEELYAHYGPALDRPVIYGDFADLPYLHCVIKESLRLYPPIPAVGRCLESDLILGEADGAAGAHVVPAGTNVIVLLWQLLHDEQLYEDPLRFWPERHLDSHKTAETGAARACSSYIPFSAGPRNCIGQRFALLELKTIVIKMLRHFELLPLGVDVKPSIKIVLRSATGVNLGLKKRSYAN